MSDHEGIVEGKASPNSTLSSLSAANLQKDQDTQSNASEESRRSISQVFTQLAPKKYPQIIAAFVGEQGICIQKMPHNSTFHLSLPGMLLLRQLLGLVRSCPPSLG